MEQIFEFITCYGLPVFIIASIIIGFIGILKLCKVFNKITNANIKKLIYYILNIVLAFALSAIYFAIFQINFSGYIAYAFTQISATTTLYAIYENFGVRKLVQIFLNWIASKFKKDPESKFVKTLKSIGLTEEAIVKIQTVASVELAKQKDNPVNKQ